MELNGIMSAQAHSSLAVAVLLLSLLRLLALLLRIKVGYFLKGGGQHSPLCLYVPVCEVGYVSK